MRTAKQGVFGAQNAATLVGALGSASARRLRCRVLFRTGSFGLLWSRLGRCAVYCQLAGWHPFRSIGRGVRAGALGRSTAAGLLFFPSLGPISLARVR
jgi:hypothetical protein